MKSSAKEAITRLQLQLSSFLFLSYFSFNPLSPFPRSYFQTSFHLLNNIINTTTEGLPSQSNSHSSFKAKNIANIKNMGFAVKTSLGSNSSSTSNSQLYLLPRLVVRIKWAFIEKWLTHSISSPTHKSQMSPSL